MKEADQTKRTDNHWKSTAVAGIVAAVGLGIGFAFQTIHNDELMHALSMANSKIGLLSSREKSLTTDLEEAKNRASATGTEWFKARDENLALTKKLIKAEEDAKNRERRLHETVVSLKEELTASIARANTLSAALGPEKMSEIEGSKATSSAGTGPSAKDTAVARNKELLKKFTRTSDDFTRPKVFVHDNFLRRRKESKSKSEAEAHARLTGLTVNSEGVTSGVSFTSLKVISGDDVITFTELDSLIKFLGNHDFTDGDLKCRVSWEELDIGKNPSNLRDRYLKLSTSSNVGDTSLDKEDAVAFTETIELASSFEEIIRMK